MKKLAVATLLLAAFGMVIPAQQARAQVSVSVSIGTFYDELSPHGEWIDCSYGECWVPRGVAAGWQPDTTTAEIYTRYGWTWVSDDPWGGDPYHYGTWAFVGRYGWVWVPGTVWAPAWVTWCYSDRYVGWAPMPPTVTFGSSGYSGRAVVVNQTQYVFVPTNRFVGTNVTSVRMEPARNAELFRQAKPVTRFEVSGGIVTNVALPVATVQRAMNTKIQTREISTARTAPRTLASGGFGKSAHVAIVAPARDVKAARASRQQAPPHAATKEPQRQQEQAKQQVQAKTQQRQQEQAKQQKQAKPQQRQQEQAKQQGQAKAQRQQEQAIQQRQQGQAKQQEQAKGQQRQQQAKPQLEARPQQARQEQQPQPQQPKAGPQQPRADVNPPAQHPDAIRPGQPGEGRGKAMPPGQQKKGEQPGGKDQPK